MTRVGVVMRSVVTCVLMTVNSRISIVVVRMLVLMQVLVGMGVRVLMRVRLTSMRMLVAMDVLMFMSVNMVMFMISVHDDAPFIGIQSRESSLSYTVSVGTGLVKDVAHLSPSSYYGHTNSVEAVLSWHQYSKGSQQDHARGERRATRVAASEWFTATATEKANALRISTLGSSR